MSEEGRVIVRSPSLNPMKIAGSPHWHPAIQACVIPERSGIVALVRRLIWKSFLNGRWREPYGGPWAEGRGGRCRHPAGGPSEPFRGPPGPKLFFRFFA